MCCTFLLFICQEPKGIHQHKYWFLQWFIYNGASFVLSRRRKILTEGSPACDVESSVLVYACTAGGKRTSPPWVDDVLLNVPHALVFNNAWEFLKDMDRWTLSAKSRAWTEQYVCFSCVLDGDFATEKGTSSVGCGRASFSSRSADS